MIIISEKINGSITSMANAIAARAEEWINDNDKTKTNASTTNIHHLHSDEAKV